MFGALTPITKNLIILNVVVFVLSFFVPYLYLILPAYFPYSPNFRSWQVVTHMFIDRKSTRLNSSHRGSSRMPSSA